MLPPGYCERKTLNLEKTTSSVLSVLLLIYAFNCFLSSVDCHHLKITRLNECNIFDSLSTLDQIVINEYISKYIVYGLNISVIKLGLFSIYSFYH